jgi:hypothetical protein
MSIGHQGGQGTAGSHWEKRVLNVPAHAYALHVARNAYALLHWLPQQEFMTGVGVYGDYSAKTAITLAAMEVHPPNLQQPTSRI